MTTDVSLPTPAEPTPADFPATQRPSRGSLRYHLAGLRMILVLTVLLGLAYPLAVTAIAQLPGLKDKADGSLITDGGGRVVGSTLIGQGFVDPAGNPLRQWFQSRPSAAGTNGYDPTASGASNLGPTNPDLVKAILARRVAIAAFDSVPGHPVAPGQVPPDAVTSSGSGLDPDISPQYAQEQVYRVALARGLPPATVARLVDRHTSGRLFGFIGEPRVNVVELNVALNALRR